MMGLFNFNSLITPTIVKILFYAGIALSVIGAYQAISYGLEIDRFAPGYGRLCIFAGLMVAPVGIIASRVITELVLVLFMIRDELAWQRVNTHATAAE